MYNLVENLKVGDRMAEKNYKFFTERFDELYERYADKYIAIKDCGVIGAYDSFAEAVDKTVQSEELGTFSVQHCSREDIDGYNFYSNNVLFGVA